MDGNWSNHVNYSGATDNIRLVQRRVANKMELALFEKIVVIICIIGTIAFIGYVAVSYDAWQSEESIIAPTSTVIPLPSHTPAPTRIVTPPPIPTSNITSIHTVTETPSTTVIPTIAQTPRSSEEVLKPLETSPKPKR